MTQYEAKDRDEAWMLVEKQILRDTAQIIKLQVREIAKYPTATNLIPIKEALSILGQQGILLEEISK